MDLPVIVYVLLGLIIALQIACLIFVVGLAGRVRRLSQDSSPESQSRGRSRTAGVPVPEPAFPSEDFPAPEERPLPEQGQHFAEFLAEDPSRAELSKKEQFEAFRRWRSERGLNWRGN